MRNKRKGPAWHLDHERALETVITYYYIERLPLTARSDSREEAARELAKRILREPSEEFAALVEKHRGARSDAEDFEAAAAPLLREYGKDLFPDLFERPAGPFLGGT